MADENPVLLADFDDNINPIQVAPRRNPSLIQRIAARWFTYEPTTGPQPQQRQTTQTGVTDPSIDVSDKFFSFKFDADRLAIYRDADEMDSNSDEVSTALDIIADNITTSEDGTQLSFVVHSEDVEVQKILEEVTTTARLANGVKRMARNFVKYGDLFAEIVVNAAGQILPLRMLQPMTMERNEDKYGNLIVLPPVFEDGKCLNNPQSAAFVQVESEVRQNVVAAFWPWQILHARLNDDGFRKYGRSQLRVARFTWRQLKALIEALIIGRLTRDLLKLVFYVDTTNLAPAQKATVLRKFRESIETNRQVDQKRESPFSVLTNFYVSDGYARVGNQAVPLRTRVEAIDPKNEGLHDITDIEFLNRKLIMDLRVPSAHLNQGQQSDVKGALTQVDVQYVRWLRNVQRELGLALEQVFDLALAMHGIDPMTVEYTITWPALRATDEAAAAQTELARSQSDQIYLQERVLSPTWVQKHRFNMDDEEIEEVNSENEEIADAELEQAMAVKATAQTAGSNTTNRTANYGNPPAGQSAHRDVDGKRKGDEGRSRDGKRIAPTKSKKGTPKGSGSRSRKGPAVRNEKRVGEASDPVRIFLEYVKTENPVVAEKIAARKPITQAYVTPAPALSGYRYDPDGDGDDDSTPEGDTDHDHYTADGHQRMADCDCATHLFAYPEHVDKNDPDLDFYKCVECGCPYICECHSQERDNYGDKLRSVNVRQEYASEFKKRTSAHNHEHMGEVPVLTFDLHKTLTPDPGFPLRSHAYKGVQDFMRTMESRGCCIHCASSSLDQHDLELHNARVRMAHAWSAQEGLPIEAFVPKTFAHRHVDDRGVEIPPDPDWYAIAQEAEKRFLKTYELVKGVYVQRDLTPKGEKIEDWPDPSSAPPDRPRGLTEPIIDIDYHRTLSPAWGSSREGKLDPDGVKNVNALYDDQVQVYLSCAGFNRGTHAAEDSARRLAAMQIQASREGVHYDRFATKDDAELTFDDRMIRYTTWPETYPKIVAAVKAERALSAA